MSKQVIALVVAGLALMCVLCGVGAYLRGVNTLRGYREVTQTGSRFLTLLQQAVCYAYTPSTSTVPAGAPTKRIMR